MMDRRRGPAERPSSPTLWGLPVRFGSAASRVLSCVDAPSGMKTMITGSSGMSSGPAPGKPSRADPRVVYVVSTECADVGDALCGMRMPAGASGGGRPHVPPDETACAAERRLPRGEELGQFRVARARRGRPRRGAVTRPGRSRHGIRDRGPGREVAPGQPNCVPTPVQRAGRRARVAGLVPGVTSRG